MALVRGRSIWDPRIGPRDDPNAWGPWSNPALICFDWWTSGFDVDPETGCLRENPREITELDVQFLREAADWCDELVDPAEAAEHGFVFQGTDAR